MAQSYQKIEDYIHANISLDQIRAQIRRPVHERQLGKKMEQLTKNEKPWKWFDIDETLTYERGIKTDALNVALAKLKARPTSVRAWSDWQPHLKHDVIEPEMAKVFRDAKAAGTHNIGMLTARSQRATPATKRMLRRNNLVPDVLIMRPLDQADKTLPIEEALAKANETMRSGPYKLGMLDRYGVDAAKIDNFYDDTKSVIDALHGRGIPGTLVIPKSLEGGLSKPAVREVATEVIRSTGRRTRRLLVDALDAAKAVSHAVNRG